MTSRPTPPENVSCKGRTEATRGLTPLGKIEESTCCSKCVKPVNQKAETPKFCTDACHLEEEAALYDVNVTCLMLADLVWNTSSTILDADTAGTDEV